MIPDTWPDKLDNQCDASIMIDGTQRHCLFDAEHEHVEHRNQFTNRIISWRQFLPDESTED